VVLLKVGAEVDIASGDELNKWGQKILGKSDPLPLYKDLAASVTGTGAVPTVVLGRPPVGRVWKVSAVTLVGNNDHSSISSPLGFVAMYFGDSANPNLAQVKVVKIALPSTVFMSGPFMLCHASQEVFFIGDLALNVPDNLTITAIIEEWRTADIMDNSGAP
jgi:hypothetical protein